MIDPFTIMLATTALAGGVSALGSSSASSSAQKASQQQADTQIKASEQAAKALKPYQRLLRDPGTIIQNSLNTNFANLAQAGTLAAKVNERGQNEFARVMERLAPGVMGNIRASYDIAGQMARGQLPDDVSAVIQNAAAERGNRLGFVPGSRAGEALVARDLGMTSLDLTERGANSLQKWIQSSRSYLLPTLKTAGDYLADPTQFAQLAKMGADITRDVASLRMGGQVSAADTISSGLGQAATADSAMYKTLAEGIAGLGGAYFGREQGRIDAEKQQTRQTQLIDRWIAANSSKPVA